MNSFFKYILLFGFACLIVSTCFYYDAHSQVIFYKTEYVEDKGFKPARFLDLNRLTKDNYIPNVLYIKTTFSPIISKSGELTNHLELALYLKNINVSSILKPFADYVQSNLLSSSKNGLERILQIRYNSEKSIETILLELNSLEFVEYAEPIFKNYLQNEFPDDPEYSKQYYLKAINAEQAWEVSTGAENIIIGIIDSGIDYSHEDLDTNIWLNELEYPPNGHDNDGNGFKDDFIGWDFIGDITPQEAIQFLWKPNNDTKPKYVTNEHGTHVAGIASAITNNSLGIASLGGNAKLMPLKITADNINESQGGISQVFRTEEAMLYATAMGADILNCSWSGSNYSQVVQDVINDVTQMGTLVVVAAGNDGSDYDVLARFPAYYDNVLSVGSLGTNARSKALSSSYGSKITTYVPGVSIYSTTPENQYKYKTGTSMATPVISGLAALVKSVRPEWLPQQIAKQIRVTSVDSIFYPEGMRSKYYGRADAGNAMKYNILPNFNKPGISVLNTYINSNDGVIRSYNNYNIKLDLFNWLATVENVNIKIKPLDYFVTLSEENFNIALFENMSAREISFNLKLEKNTPWFFGIISFLVEISSVDYIDYHLVQLPMELKTLNTFRIAREFEDKFEWSDMSAFGKDVVLLGGRHSNNRGLVYKYGTFEWGGVISDEPIRFVKQINNNIAYALSVTTDKAELFKTSDSEIYTKQGETINYYINNIYFRTETNAFAIGDPKDNKFRYIEIANSGINRTEKEILPLADLNEFGIDGSLAYFSPYIWFSTNKNNIYKSSNNGSEWEKIIFDEQKYIYKMSFANKDSGMAIYSSIEPIQDVQYNVASTFDGGKSWEKDLLNFTEYGLQPIHIHHTANTDRFLIICKNGSLFSTTDYGNTWQTVDNYMYKEIQVTAVSDYEDRTRIWSMQEELVYLDILQMPKDAKIELTAIPDNEINFGNVNVNTNENRSIILKNTGQLPLIIDDVLFRQSSENPSLLSFELISEIPDFLEPDEEFEVEMKFSPTLEGEYKGNIIATIRDYGDVIINVLAIATKDVSVNDNDYENEIKILQNPVSELLLIETGDFTGQNADISIYNILGQKINILYSGLLNDKMEFNISQFPVGMYILNFDFGGRIKNYIFVRY